MFQLFQFPYWHWASNPLETYFCLSQWYQYLKDNREWTFWQYTDKARLDGYNGKEKRIDINVFNGSMDEFEKLFNLCIKKEKICE